MVKCSLKAITIAQISSNPPVSILPKIYLFSSILCKLPYSLINAPSFFSMRSRVEEWENKYVTCKLRILANAFTNNIYNRSSVPVASQSLTGMSELQGKLFSFPSAYTRPTHPSRQNSGPNPSLSFSSLLFLTQ